VLWLTDKRNRDVGVCSAKIAYIARHRRGARTTACPRWANCVANTRR
jgi:hypothetical protein